MKNTRRSSVPWRLASAAALGIVAGACAGGGGEVGTRSAQVAQGEVVGCAMARVPLTVDEGLFAYIEPENLLRMSEDFLVVGTPTYTWEPGPDGDTLPRTANQYIAARFSLDGHPTLIEKPLDVPIGDVRAVSLGGDRWGVLFDEEESTLPSRSVKSLALWYAEHDGTRWTTLESVPYPAEATVRAHSSTGLVRAGDDLVWVVPVDLEGGRYRLVEYRRTADGWVSEVVSEDAVEVSALAYDPDWGLWLAQFSEDPDLPGWQQSLRLYRRSDTWDLVRRVVVMPEERKVRDPGITIFSTGVTVSWRVESREDMAAYTLVDVTTEDDGVLLTLDPRVWQVMPLTPPDDRPAWVVRHLVEDPPGVELRLLRPGRDGGAELVAATAPGHPAGQASLALAPTEALIVGPQVEADPAYRYLRSLIIRLSPSCT
jgi:hypothetical protein